ncbi:MAG TPA: hypothetical protein ENN17_08630, partial [bacterium]|nr:hypothetical protein [bacterium]
MKRGLLLLISVLLIAVPCLFAQNIIQNGEFDDGETGWDGWIDGGSTNIVKSIDDTGVLSGPNSYKFEITEGSADVWRIQRNTLCPIELGHMYSVSFIGIADDSAQILVLFEENQDPWNKRLEEWVWLTPTKQSFEFIVNYSPVTDPTNHLKFQLGGTINNGKTIWLDSVVVRDIGTSMDIVVDAQRDPFYETLTGPDEGYLQLKSYAYNDNGIPAGDADLSAKMWFAWDEEWLYFYGEVKDDMISMTSANTYQNDGWEIKIDPEPTDSVANSVWATEMTALYEAGTAGHANGLADSSLMQTARRLTNDGYALECAIKWSAITQSGETIDPAVGNIFGAAVHVHDNDNTTGQRDASVAWAANLVDAVWNTPKYHGTVEFLADNKLKFIPTNNMTGQTNPVPYDGTPFYMRINAQKEPFYHQLTGPDDGYLQIKSYAFNDNGIPRGDADLSAQIWAAWDDEWFYLYQEVRDDTIAHTSADSYMNDCIELKIDPQPTDSTQQGPETWSGSASIWDTRLSAPVTAAAVSQDNLGNIPDSLKQWARRTIASPRGYALELAIHWSAIESGNGETIDVGEGNVFGLAINQHDNDGKGRQASISWGAVMLDNNWNRPKYLGTVQFLADNKLQFIPTNNMTGTTNPIPYDGTPFYMRIDGQKDPFYHRLTGPANGYLQLRSYAFNDNGAPDDDDDLSAKIWTAWDDDWFYLYQEVKDDIISGNATNVWENDCIELKFDPEPTDSTQGGTSIWDTRLTALGPDDEGVVSSDNLNNVADSLKHFVRRSMPGGYALELAINWSAIASGNGETVDVGEGNIFGLAINQHDNDGTAARVASVMWGAVMLDAAWNT